MRTPTGPPDATYTAEIDTAFYGIDNRREPGLVRTTRGYAESNQELTSPGLLADGQNIRLEDGTVKRRGGILPPPELNDFSTIPGLVASGVWRDPAGVEWIVAVQPEDVWLLACNRNKRRIPLPDGITLEAPVEVVAVFDQILLPRGTGKRPLEWRGNYRTGFQVIAKRPGEATPSYIDPLPNIPWAVEFQDRSFFPVSDDTMGFSDLLDFTRTDSTLAQIRLNQGESDTITAAAPYQGNRLIVFKKSCIYFIEGLTPAMDAYRADKLPMEGIGCIARKTLTAVGGNLYWLGTGGVYALTQTIDGSLRGENMPLSWPVQKWIERINWRAAPNAVAIFDPTRSLYLLAVPIDGANVNNALLCYDTVARQWISLDKFDRPTSAALPVPGGNVLNPARPWEIRSRSDLLAGITNLHTHPVHGTRAVVMATGLHRFYALLDGEYDLVNGTRYEPLQMIRTRGYLLSSLEVKQVRQLIPALATHDAEVTLIAWTDGVNEAQPLTVATRRSRTASSLWNTAAWDPSNANDDFARPDRQDYTWHMTDQPALRSGLPLRLMQDWNDPQNCRTRDCRWISLQVLNTTGHTALKSLLALGSPPPHKARAST